MTDQILQPITHEDFFAYVESHPDTRFDFIDGELVEVSPKPLHGYLQARLTILLGKWLEGNPIGIIHTEVLHVLGGDKFMPDISINQEKAYDHAYFDTPPLLAVEIRSDTQSRAAQRRKALRYIAQQTPAVLLILPGEGIELFTQETGETPQVFKGDQLVKDIPGLDGLQIKVSELFA